MRLWNLQSMFQLLEENRKLEKILDSLEKQIQLYLVHIPGLKMCPNVD